MAQKLSLLSLNNDVLIHIASFANVQELKALTSTCRAIHPIGSSALLHSVFLHRDPTQVANFCAFVLASPATRAPLIQTLTLGNAAYHVPLASGATPPAPSMPIMPGALVIHFTDDGGVRYGERPEPEFTADAPFASALAEVLTHAVALRRLMLPNADVLLAADSAVGPAISALPSVTDLTLTRAGSRACALLATMRAPLERLCIDIAPHVNGYAHDPIHRVFSAFELIAPFRESLRQLQLDGFVSLRVPSWIKAEEIGEWPALRTLVALGSDASMAVLSTVFPGLRSLALSFLEDMPTGGARDEPYWPDLYWLTASLCGIHEQESWGHVERLTLDGELYPWSEDETGEDEENTIDFEAGGGGDVRADGGVDSDVTMTLGMLHDVLQLTTPRTLTVAVLPQPKTAEYFLSTLSQSAGRLEQLKVKVIGSYSDGRYEAAFMAAIPTHLSSQSLVYLSVTTQAFPEFAVSVSDVVDVSTAALRGYVERVAVQIPSLRYLHLDVPNVWGAPSLWRIFPVQAEGDGACVEQFSASGARRLWDEMAAPRDVSFAESKDMIFLSSQLICPINNDL